MNFTLEDFDNYSYQARKSENKALEALIKGARFKNSSDIMAFIGYGGTISSAYSPSRENIAATQNSPAIELLDDLGKAFGIAPNDYSYIPLMDKDSRDITVDDIVFLLDFLNTIENRRVILTCGTYGLPLFTQIIGKHTKGKGRVIGITGSILISPFKEQDVDFNAGGIITAVNALAKRASDSQPIEVFAGFHGSVFDPQECANLDLHPESHKDVEFYRTQRLVR